MGRYDQSLSRYHRALELRRAAGDRRGAAIEAYGIGTLFDSQGRYGAAVKSKEEALQALRQLNARDMWLGEVLSGYGNSLALSGRLDDAGRALDEAMTLARELQNATLTAQTQRFQAARQRYIGDLGSARRLADQAAQTAARTSDPSLSLLAQATAAMIAAEQQPTRQSIARLASLAQEADALSVKPVAIECAIARARGLLALGDRTAALQELDRTLTKAEPLGFRLQLAEAQVLRATALQSTDAVEARRAYGNALRLLTDIRGEEGSQEVRKRVDVERLFQAAERGASAR
jgi:tetratricopeptide (TPR) repeat protein